jgi:hypothetical protein
MSTVILPVLSAKVTPQTCLQSSFRCWVQKSLHRHVYSHPSGAECNSHSTDTSTVILPVLSARVTPQTRIQSSFRCWVQEAVTGHHAEWRDEGCMRSGAYTFITRQKRQHRRAESPGTLCSFSNSISVGDKSLRWTNFFLLLCLWNGSERWLIVDEL